MPHRRKKHRDSQLVAPDVSRLFLNLCHPDDIVFRIETIESGRSMIKLIAQNQNEVTHGGGSICAEMTVCDDH